MYDDIRSSCLCNFDINILHQWAYVAHTKIYNVVCLFLQIQTNYTRFALLETQSYHNLALLQIAAVTLSKALGQKIKFLGGTLLNKTL